MSWPSPWPRAPAASKPSAKAQSPRPRSPPLQTSLPAASKPASTATASARPKSPPPQTIGPALSTRPGLSQRLHTTPPTLQSTTVTTTQVSTSPGGPQYVRLTPQDGPLGRGHYFTSSDGSMEFYAAPASRSALALSPPSITPPQAFSFSPPRAPAEPLDPQFVELYEKIMKYEPKGGDDDYFEMVDIKGVLYAHLENMPGPVRDKYFERLERRYRELYEAWMKAGKQNLSTACEAQQ
ncbi:hypothetical protein B0A48_02041 [Cryoendolithus antarcticus]|uniref:Uncharacterized protein n=1 Tax=Cryoendolithus antarcticus TaxID=1507870 RepID=A0A1V8TMH2_9PEZI|nr:hypothetical protein B0A48_02041 [Cryoendolithus antarcticus]